MWQHAMNIGYALQNLSNVTLKIWPWCVTLLILLWLPYALVDTCNVDTCNWSWFTFHKYFRFDIMHILDWSWNCHTHVYYCTAWTQGNRESMDKCIVFPVGNLNCGVQSSFIQCRDETWFPLKVLWCHTDKVATQVRHQYQLCKKGYAFAFNT